MKNHQTTTSNNGIKSPNNMKITPSNHTTKRAHSQGFTLLEIVIVLGIIAVILGGSIAVVGKLTDGAKLQRVTSDFNVIKSAVNTYKLNAGTFPSTSQGLQALVTRPTSTPAPKNWTKLADSVFIDPWENPYLYAYPGKIDPTTFEIISKGPDGQQGTEDDLSSQK